MLVKSIVSITTPGHGEYSQEHVEFDLIEEWVREKKESKYVDSIKGWDNLNQEWLQFEGWVQTSFGPVSLEFLSEEVDKIFFDAQMKGKVLVNVRYKTKDGSFVPHESFPEKEGLITKED